MALASLICYGQNNLNDQFEFNGYEYEITSVNSNEVKIVDYTGSATEVDIPGMVDYNNETYMVRILIFLRMVVLFDLFTERD